MNFVRSAQILVEGEDDKWVVVNLLSMNGIFVPSEWGSFVKPFSQVGLVRTLQVALKTTSNIGVILDRDDETTSALRARISEIESAVKLEELNVTREGLVRELPPEDGRKCRKLGIWVMPDNVNDGALEEFLATLVPPSTGDLWRHAREASLSAQSHGAEFGRLSKAQLRAWLAWQKQPGVPPGEAIKRGYLLATSGVTTAFLDWFRRLFGAPDMTDASSEDNATR